LLKTDQLSLNTTLQTLYAFTSTIDEIVLGPAEHWITGGNSLCDLWCPTFNFQFFTRLAAVFAEEVGGFGFLLLNGQI
jgi:hypothetical protein